MKVDLTLHTDGSGFWSMEARSVHIAEIVLNYFSGSAGGYGELIAVFDDWDPKESGLVYTDELWIKEFREALASLGVPAKCVAAVNYSEQGMQGEKYVSMDACHDFFSPDNPIKQQLLEELRQGVKAPA